MMALFQEVSQSTITMSQQMPLHLPRTGSPEWNAAIVSIIRYACACPASQNVCRQNGLTVTKNTFQAPASSSERISTAHETSNFVLILLLLILLSRLTKEENVIM